MIFRQPGHPFAAHAAARPASPVAAPWLLAAIMVWLCATLALSGPGVAILVVAGQCETDAPEENERTALNESSHSSHSRRYGLRQVVHRRAILVHSAMAIAAPRNATSFGPSVVPGFLPDARFGAGIPLRC